MNLLRLFKRNPGRDLSRIGHHAYRSRVRSRVDQMRKDMGMKPVPWGRL